jgi:flagellin
MTLNINSNTQSLDAQTAYDKTRQSVSQVLAELSSGASINSAADNPAGLAIAQGLTTQINGDQQGINNAVDGVSLTQTASSALNQLQSNTQQIQQIAVEAGNGALSDTDRQALQQQVDQLTQANSQIIQTTQQNGAQLLAGNGAQSFQVGSGNQITINASGLDNTSQNGGLNSYNANPTATNVINVTTQANALGAQSALTQDLNTLNTAQTNIGASANALTTALNTLQTASVNAQTARSAISDTDYAAATASLAQQQILGNAAIAAQGQANVSQSAALALLSQ